MRSTPSVLETLVMLFDLMNIAVFQVSVGRRWGRLRASWSSQFRKSRQVPRRAMTDLPSRFFAMSYHIQRGSLSIWNEFHSRMCASMEVIVATMFIRTSTRQLLFIIIAKVCIIKCVLIAPRGLGVKYVKIKGRWEHDKLKAGDW